VHVSTKGARLNNEDSFVADGRFFGVFDGHIGNSASVLCQQHVVSLSRARARSGALSAHILWCHLAAVSCGAIVYIPWPHVAYHKKPIAIIHSLLFLRCGLLS
jgi:hypothetical protein